MKDRFTGELVKVDTGNERLDWSKGSDMSKKVERIVEKYLPEKWIKDIYIHEEFSEEDYSKKDYDEILKVLL